ncbi:MAG: hypothetical protein K0U41_08515 [Gammaproteobacteria bacterium]|nr:hypothetical protein [Gammaproteobacteria bacterium]
MKKVILYGDLAEKFIPEFEMNVNSPIEAVRCLEANFPGKFLKAIQEGEYRFGTENKEYMDLEHVLMHTGAKEIHIEPIISGAGGGGRNKGLFTTIIGVVIIAAATVASGGTAAGFAGQAFAGLTYGNLAVIGVGLLVAGVSTMMARVPETGDYADREDADERPTALFNGALNRAEQGGPVPLVYGTHLVGSVVISTSLSVADLSSTLPRDPFFEPGRGGGRFGTGSRFRNL